MQQRWCGEPPLARRCGPRAYSSYSPALLTKVLAHYSSHTASPPLRVSRERCAGPNPDTPPPPTPAPSPRSSSKRPAHPHPPPPPPPTLTTPSHTGATTPCSKGHGARPVAHLCRSRRSGPLLRELLPSRPAVPRPPREILSWAGGARRTRRTRGATCSSMVAVRWGRRRYTSSSLSTRPSTAASSNCSCRSSRRRCLLWPYYYTYGRTMNLITVRRHTNYARTAPLHTAHARRRRY
jgi:hypothetical protein